MRILLATPCSGGQVHYKYCQSLLSQTFNAPERLLNQERYNVALYQVAGYSGLGKDRGVIASYALRNNFDKVFFIDADQSWSWKQFKAIADSEKPITAGVVALKQYPIQLNFTPRVEDMDCFELEDGKITPKGLERLFQKYNRTPEIKVQCMGTAFMGIDIKVLEKMTEGCPSFYYADMHSKQKVKCWDFFQSGAIENVYFGEDWGFCAVAKRFGFDAYIHAETKVTHHGAHDYIIGNELSEGPNAL